LKLLKYIITFYTHNDIFKCIFLGKNNFNYTILTNSKINYFNHNNMIIMLSNIIGWQTVLLRIDFRTQEWLYTVEFKLNTYNIIVTSLYTQLVECFTHLFLFCLIVFTVKRRLYVCTGNYCFYWYSILPTGYYLLP